MVLGSYCQTNVGNAFREYVNGKYQDRKRLPGHMTAKLVLPCCGIVLHCLYLVVFSASSLKFNCIPWHLFRSYSCSWRPGQACRPYKCSSNYFHCFTQLQEPSSASLRCESWSAQAKLPKRNFPSESFWAKNFEQLQRTYPNENFQAKLTKLIISS